MQNQPVVKIYRRASQLGFHLEDDLAFQNFLFKLHNSEAFNQMVDAIRQTRMDLFENAKAEAAPPEEQYDFEVDAITEQLLRITTAYSQTKDAVVLRQSLSDLSTMLARGKN